MTNFAIAIDANHHGYIDNLHPLGSEPKRFASEDKTQETAIIAFLPGPQPGTHILIFSGLTTIGTQMAVEYACRPEAILELTQRAGLIHGELHPFEAVLGISVSKGVGVSSQLLLVHKR